MTADLTQGRLELEFRTQGPGGRTVLARRAQRFPLRMTVPLYLDPGDPGMAFVYVQNPTGGLFPGDDLAMRFAVGSGARVHVTSSSATKVYGCGGEARQRIEFVLDPGAYAEYVPEPLIPQGGARLCQQVVVEMADDASFFMAESLAPGRVAHGEAFAYERLALRTTIVAPDGRERCVDALVLQPGRIEPGRKGLLGTHAYLGSALAIAPSADARSLASVLDASLVSLAGGVAGVGALPSECGVFVRGLTDTGERLRSLLRTVWATVRPELIGIGPPRSRK